MMPNATDQTAPANTPKASNKDAGGRMWGWPLEFWDKVVFWALVVTALAGALSVTTGFAAGLLAYWTGGIEKMEFDKKLRASNLEIEVARASAAEANKIAAEATERANNAALELAKYRAPRRIAESQIEKLASKLLAFGGIEFEIGVPNGNREAEILAEQIERVLLAAAWKPVDWKGGVLLMGRGDRNKWGYISANGIVILFDPSEKTLLEKPAETLAALLAKEGFASVFGPRESEGADRERILRVLVGQKT